MKTKWALLLTGFVAVYFVLHITYDLPGLVHGNPRFLRMPAQWPDAWWLMTDVAVSFLYALLPCLILQRSYPSGQWLLAAGLMLICLPALFLLHYSIAYQAGRTLRLRAFFQSNLLYVSIYAIYGVVYYFIRYSYYKELQQRELLLHSRQAELSFLRSQINPHFLFNSLNNIYSLAYRQSDLVLPAIASLSDLLRYMLYNNTEKAPLQQELDYVRKYIDLQKLRFEQPISVQLHTAGETQMLIAPLLLIPFVENAFKHGDLSAEEGGMVMNIYTTGEKLHFYCRNKTSKKQKDAGGGIGLENVKRRLELLYPGKHDLLIEDKNDYFTINLELYYA